VTVAEIAKFVGGKLRGDPSVEIKGIARLPEAKEGEITYSAHPRYKRFLATTKASCIIVPKGFTELKRTVIEVADPDLCFIKLVNFFHKRELPPRGIDRRATIGKNVNIGKDVSIGALTCIENDVRIGDKVTIFPSVYIGMGVRIGEGSLIYPNATIKENVILGKNVIIGTGSVIGSDGFGYVRRASNHIKIPQVGGVIIEDDVEIGANVTIDRGSLGNTIIKRGTKIDNLVHIAHNVVIGENSIIVAQVGIAGSTEVGKDVTIAGQVGITDHIKIGNNVIIGGKSGVTKSLNKGVFSGYPARPHNLSKKIYSLLGRLPDLFNRVKKLECKKQ